MGCFLQPALPDRSSTQRHPADGERVVEGHSGLGPWQGRQLSPEVQDPALMVQKGVFMLSCGSCEGRRAGSQLLPPHGSGSGPPVWEGSGV